jgi:amino acid transporter
MHQQIVGNISHHMLVCILYTHIRFMKGQLPLYDHRPVFTSSLGLAARGISRDTLPYKASFQPYGSWFALISTGVIMLFKGFSTFIHAKDEPFKASAFVSYVSTSHSPVSRTDFSETQSFLYRSYIGFPVFLLFAGFWKWKKGDTTVAYADMDLFTGKQEIDEEEKAYLEAQHLRGPLSRWERLWENL